MYLINFEIALILIYAKVIYVGNLYRDKIGPIITFSRE